MRGKEKEEQASGVWPYAVYGVWNHAFSLAHTTSHSGRMAAPRPTAGPFTAATMGFLNWMKVLMKVLRKRAQGSGVKAPSSLMQRLFHRGIRTSTKTRAFHNKRLQFINDSLCSESVDVNYC